MYEQRACLTIVVAKFICMCMFKCICMCVYVCACLYVCCCTGGSSSSSSSSLNPTTSLVWLQPSDHYSDVTALSRADRTRAAVDEVVSLLSSIPSASNTSARWKENPNPFNRLQPIPGPFVQNQRTPRTAQIKLLYLFLPFCLFCLLLYKILCCLCHLLLSLCPS